MVLSEVKFNSSPFWVQFHGLPLEAFDKENAVILGSEVGEVLMYENPNIDGRINRAFIRVRCMINLDKPLEPGFMIPRKEREPTKVTIKYERLQNFCYKCGRIGHDMKNCSLNKESYQSDEEDNTYGNWLRTAHVKTLEETLIVHKSSWVEAHPPKAIRSEEPPVAAQTPTAKNHIPGKRVSGHKLGGN